MKDNIEEVKKLCGPIVEYLNKYNPYTSVVITNSSIKIEETQMNIPLKND